MILLSANGIYVGSDPTYQTLNGIFECLQVLLVSLPLLLTNLSFTLP